MSTQEYLKKAYLQNTAIDAKIERVRKLRLMADLVNSESEETRSKILHMEREIDRDIDSLIDRHTAIDRVIREIPDERDRMILELRYLNHLPWEEIGLRLYMDVRWTQRLHNRAIAGIRIPEAQEAG